MPTESSTAVTPGIGDNIRDFVVTRPDGTQIKIQAIAVVDAHNLANTQTVDESGAALVSDQEAIDLLNKINTHLEVITHILNGLAS